MIANNPDLFRETYGFYPDRSGFSFHLSNSGDSVRIFDAQGHGLESVDYDDRSPWPEAADGQGASLERRHPLLPASLPDSWAASTSQGTPGKPNSVYIDQPPPVIWVVDHSPKIPKPGENLTVTARVYSVKSNLVSVVLHYGINSGNDYTAVSMFDDGRHEDGSASDGVYGARIPGAALGTILRFYLHVEDADGQTTTLPAEGAKAPILTVVENQSRQEGVATLQIVMTPETQKRFLDRYQTDDYSPATFYDNDTVYYSIQIRHRGRARSPNARFKILFPPHQLFRNQIRRLNLNGADYTSLLNEYLSYRLYEEAGLPTFETEIVRFLENGQPAGIPFRVAIENPDAQFLHRKRFFSDDSGNLYKTTLDGTPQNKATWRYVGDDPSLYSGCYLKQTNEDEADYSDVIRLCKMLTEAEPWDADFTDKVRSVLNTDGFLRWMAVSALVAHWDSPFTDHGQNYVLYHDPARGQFNVLPWDLNGTFEYSSNPEDLNYRKLYTHPRSTKFTAINKILNHPVFGAKYYREIDGLLETIFTKKSMEQRIESARLDLQLNSGSVQYLKTYVEIRRKDLAQWINNSVGVVFLSKPNYQTPVGEPYTYRATAVDYRNENPITYQMTSGPPWLSIDPKIGAVYGTPLETGKYEITLTAQTDGGVKIDQSYTLQVVESRPRLILTFNEADGPALDLSRYGHVGQFEGRARRVQGRLGSALYLGGSGDWVRIPHSDDLSLTGAVTVEAWIRPDVVTTGNPVILSKGNEDRFNYQLMLGYGPFSWDVMEPGFMPHRFDPANRVYYGRKEIEARLQPQRWYHIAGTYDSESETVCVYCNNRRIVESSSRALMQENLYDLAIGLNGARGFRGAVDDVKILPFAKKAFAAGLCLSRVDVSGISSAQDRLCLSLSPHRVDGLNSADFAVYLKKLDRWLCLPAGRLYPGQTIGWWLDDLGLECPLPNDEIIALYPAASLGTASPTTVLDQVVWGKIDPAPSDPGVGAGLWRENRSLPLSDRFPYTLSLAAFGDNDDMDLDWSIRPQDFTGPILSSVTINEGSAQTDERKVRIDLQFIGQPTEVRISNTPSFDSDWLPFRSNFSWELSPTAEMKTVYVQARNQSLERSPVAIASIRLIPQTRVDDWKKHR